MRMIKPLPGKTALTAKEMLVCQIYAYQKFKASKFLDKINHFDFKEASVKAIHAELRRYLCTGETKKYFGPELYRIIDRCKKEALDILIPTASDALKPWTKRTRTVNKKQKPKCFGIKPDLDVTKIEISNNTLQKLEANKNEHILYGIMEADKITKTFKIYDEAVGYTQCLKDFKKSDFNLIKIQYEVIKNDSRN